jgi:hypothetical protein
MFGEISAQDSLTRLSSFRWRKVHIHNGNISSNTFKVRDTCIEFLTAKVIRLRYTAVDISRPFPSNIQNPGALSDPRQRCCNPPALHVPYHLLLPHSAHSPCGLAANELTKSISLASVLSRIATTVICDNSSEEESVVNARHHNKVLFRLQ